MFFQGYWATRAGRLGLTIHVRPPTSDDHNFFVQTSFWVFLDSMKSPLSQYSIHIPVEDSVEHNLLKYMLFQGCWPARAGRLGLTIYVRPPTLNDHNLFVRTPFWVFLNSMERSLSQDSIHMPAEDSE